MKESLDWIKEYNRIRTEVQKVDPVDPNVPLEADTVTSRAMAIAQIQANAARYKVAHTGTTPYAENLAWGYDGWNPYNGWYDSEKKIFEKLVEEAGGDPGNVNLGDNSIGHYINMCGGGKGSTGFAVNSNTDGLYPKTFAQEFGSYTGDKQYSLEEYIALFDAYYNQYVNAPQVTAEAKAALDAAKAEFTAAQNTVDEKTKATDKAATTLTEMETAQKKASDQLTKAEEDYNKATADTSTKQDNLEKALAAQESARKALETAKSDAETAQKNVSLKKEAVDATTTEWNSAKETASKKEASLDAAKTAYKNLTGKDVVTDTETAKQHTASAAKRLKVANTRKDSADHGVTGAEKTVSSAEKALKDAKGVTETKKADLTAAEKVRDDIEAKLDAVVSEKRKAKESAEKALTDAKNVSEEKNAAFDTATKALQEKKDASSVIDFKIDEAKRDLTGKTVAMDASSKTYESTKADYEKFAEEYASVLKAENNYNDAVQAEAEAKAAADQAEADAKTAEETVEKGFKLLRAALDKKDRASKLSLKDAMENAIEDEDFVYLNASVVNIKDTAEKLVEAKKVAAEKVELYNAAMEVYTSAKAEREKTSINLAYAQATYDKFVAQKEAEAKKEAEKKAAANEQVVKTATATTGEDKKSDTVKTGDPAQAGMLATTMLGGFAGIAASLKMKFRKKED